MIIDFHTHIMSPEIINQRDNYCSKDDCFASLYSHPKAILSSCEDLIASMDSCGISSSVALNIHWLDNDLCIRSNDYIIDSMTKYPERITGFISVQPQAGEAALKELERCIKCGVKGVGEIRLDLPGFYSIDSKLMDEIFNVIIMNNMVFLIHASEPVGHHYSGKGKSTPELIYSIISRYPALKIVCAHMGGGLPFYGLMPEVRELFKSTYFDTAAIPFLYKESILKYVIEILGSEKLLFGSDYPLIPPTRVLNYMNINEMDINDRDNILFNNAKALLGI